MSPMPPVPGQRRSIYINGSNLMVDRGVNTYLLPDKRILFEEMGRGLGYNLTSCRHRPGRITELILENILDPESD